MNLSIHYKAIRTLDWFRHNIYNEKTSDTTTQIIYVFISGIQ